MKINVKLTIYVAIIAAIATAVLSYTSYERILETTKADNQKSIESLVATVYDTAAISAYLNNQPLASDVVSGLAKNQIVLCATIITDQINLPLDPKCTTEKYSEPLFSPFNNTETIGTIEIYKNEERIKKIAKSLANNKIQGVILIVIISTLMTLIVTYFLVSHPIEMLARWLDQINFDNNQTERFNNKNRTDEIGKIGYKINQLLNKLDEKINKERALAIKTQKLANNFKMICDISSNALVVTDINLNLLSYNPKFKSIWQQHSCINEIILNDQWMSHIFENIDPIKLQILESPLLNEATTVEIESKHCAENKNQNTQWFNLTFAKAENMQGEINIFLFINDVTAQRQQLLKSEYEADHDSLTHLKNRRSARRVISQWISQPDMSNQLALLVIDLDGFKAVNDNHGHDAGDLVLIEIAKRLSNLIRKSDILARWGGDEFIISLNNANQAQAEKIAEKVIHALSIPINVNDEYQANIGASIGIALFPQAADNFDTLFDKADNAMYQVKKRGKNSYLVSDA